MGSPAAVPSVRGLLPLPSGASGASTPRCHCGAVLPPVDPVLAPLLEPLHAPAPQLELPVELDDDVVLSVAVPPLAPEHDALPPEVDDDVDDSVVEAEPDDD